MPKIIENPEARLLAEAKRQVGEIGYSAMTIRSVAKSCGIGVGTVYNYFPSKETLVARYLLEDWKLCMEAIYQAADSALAEPVLRCIHTQLHCFAEKHQAVFRDPGAMSGFSGSAGSYHRMLRSQLAAPLEPFCPDSFTAEFIAEALLVWTMAGKDFEELSGVLSKLLK